MKIDIEKYPKYNFFANGMISIPFIGEGRLIPSIIFEKNISSDINELCKAHINSQPGDVDVNWGAPFSFSKPKNFILKIRFKQPIESTFGIIFNGKKHFSLIDGIIQSQSLRIEAGSIGDKVSDLSNPDILIEVPRNSFSNQWETYLKSILKDMYKDKGLPKKEREKVVIQHIKTMREIWNIRRD